MKNFAIIILLLFATSLVQAQEILTGLSENPVIRESVKKQPKQLKSSVFLRPSPVELPFFDDFRQENHFPDTALWMNDFVFVNTDFPIFPPTWGAATFDAINERGYLYPDANPLQFVADQLTSKPIRLDSIFDPESRALTPADSIFLSFYYQPQGRGNDPQPQDSLILDFGTYTGDSIFSYIDSISIILGDYYPTDVVYPGDTLYSPCDPLWPTRILDTIYADEFVTLPCDSVYVPVTDWKRIWSSEGMALDTFRMGTDTSWFRQVIIPVTDTSWFRNDFQFRFYNYASIASDNLQSWQSNCDQWNIDFVKLDLGRSILDSTHQAIAFSNRAPSFLREFQSMPFYQYQKDPTGALKFGLQMYIANLDNGNQTAQYRYDVYNDRGDSTFAYDGGSYDLAPYNQSGFTDYQPFAFPEVAGVFPPFGDRDSIYFDITHYLVGDQVLGLADTMRFRQKFYNYYAYDDGTPEFGYGLTPAGARMGYQFTLNRRDTLRAVKMYFNKTLTGANNQFFNLAVWNNLNGRPGDLIYLQERERPVFEDSLYRYHIYHLDSALPVQGTIYIGWIQLTNHNLNLGFDASTDASNHIFYLVDTAWRKTSFKGALMIRPVFGKPIKDEEPEIKRAKMDFFRIAPNPSFDGMIKLKFMRYTQNLMNPEFTNLRDEVLQEMEIKVYNLMGQRVYSGRYEPQINLSYLNEGIYIIRVTDHVNQLQMSEKLLITK